MNSTLTSTQSTDASPLPGCFKLAAGRAVTLEPRRAGVLRIAHGRVWITIDAPRQARRESRGDLFLLPGDSLVLRAGERLVMEPFPTLGTAAGTASSWFMWDPVAEAAPEASRWSVAVAQPLADLRLALVMAAGAGARLVLGLAGLVVGARRGARNGARTVPRRPTVLA